MANKKNKKGEKRAVSKQKETSGGVFKRLRSKLASISPKGKDVEDVVMGTSDVQAITTMVVDASVADETALTVDATMTVEDLFLEELCDRDDPDVMGLDGISKFCESVLNIDPFEDVRALVFLWKIKATAKPGQIAKTEWTKGCANLDLATCGDLKECLPKLDPNLLTDDEFKDFYKVRTPILLPHVCEKKYISYICLRIFFSRHSFAFNSIARELQSCWTRNW